MASCKTIFHRQKSSNRAHKVRDVFLDHHLSFTRKKKTKHKATLHLFAEHQSTQPSQTTLHCSTALFTFHRPWLGQPPRSQHHCSGDPAGNRGSWPSAKPQQAGPFQMPQPYPAQLLWVPHITDLPMVHSFHFKDRDPADRILYNEFLRATLTT